MIIIPPKLVCPLEAKMAIITNIKPTKITKNPMKISQTRSVA
jgi:hypothetical protein